jgi:hypothetical protein
VATTLVAQHSHTPPSAYAFAQSIRQIIAAQCSKSWCCLSIAGWLTLVVSACIRLNPRTHMHCFVHCRFTAAQCSTVFAPASGWADARCSAVRTRFNRHAHALLIHRRFTTPCYTALEVLPGASLAGDARVSIHIASIRAPRLFTCRDCAVQQVLVPPGAGRYHARCSQRRIRPQSTHMHCSVHRRRLHVFSAAIVLRSLECGVATTLVSACTRPNPSHM